MKKAAVFIARYGVANSPSIINFLEYLSDHYAIDLYVRDVDMLDAPVLENPDINVITIRRRHILTRKLMSSIIRSDPYEHYICFNPHAFVMCKDMFPKSKPFYYCLELYMSYDNKGLYYPSDVSRKERGQINDIKGLIIQSRERERLFREDYNLSDEIPTFLLPVTFSGASDGGKSSYIRDKYGIPSDKKIVLQLGEIKWWFCCIEIARAMSRVEDSVFIIHGYYDWEYLEKLNSIIENEKIQNVIVSTEFMSSIDDLEKIIKSCDVGISWYSDYTTNMRTVGWSSGKNAAYLRSGLPVITNNYPTLVDAIEKTGCGIALDDYCRIPEALSEIYLNYNTYAKNALAEYERSYHFSRYEQELLEFLNAEREATCGIR